MKATSNKYYQAGEPAGVQTKGHRTKGHETKGHRTER